MSTPVTLLSGQPRSGKTNLLLERYAKALEAEPASRLTSACLWITPTERSRSELELAVANMLGRPVLSPGIMTFESFANRFLRRFGKDWSSISMPGQRALLRSIVLDLNSKGHLKWFSAVADRPGFLNRVMGVISELKREEIWPEAFLATFPARSGSEGDRNHELGLIYERYQRVLLEQSRFDSDGRLWAAREQTRSTHGDALRSIRLMVVDGFADFSKTQASLLREIGRQAQESWISIPGVSSFDPAQEQFRIPGQQLDRLRELFEQEPGVRMESTSGQVPQSERERTFHQIASRLFCNTREVDPLPSAKGIELWATRGRGGEVTQVVRHIRSLLNAGSHPDSIVIGLRHRERYTDLLEESLTSARIPFSSGHGRSLAREPIVRAAFSLLTLEREDWDFDVLMSVLDSGFLSPDWDEWRDRAAVRSVASVLRSRKLSVRREEILAVLERLADHRQERYGDDDDVVIAQKLLFRFSKLLAPFRKRVPFAQHAQNLLRVCETLGIAPDMVTAGEHENDLRTWSALVEVIRQASETLDSDESTASRIDLNEFAVQLSDHLRSSEVPSDDPDFGTVRVLGVEQLRDLHMDHLILLGLDEKSFPQTAIEGSLFADHDRQELAAHGQLLSPTSDDDAREMLLFHRIVCRPRQQLVLSWPELDASGEELYPSPYVTAVRGLFTDDALPVQHFGRLDPVPEFDEVQTDADLRVFATSEALLGNAGTFRTMLGSDRFQEVGQSILAACRMNASRFQQDGWSPFEGVMQSAEARQWLQERFPDNYEFSCSKLERYSECGFRFLAEQVLKLEPLDSSEPQTDYLRRGTLMHQLLADMHREHKGDPDWLRDVDGMADEFVSRVQSEMNRHRGETKLTRSLTRIEEERLKDFAREYASQHAHYLDQFSDEWTDPPEPFVFEVGFGEVPDEPGADEQVYHAVEIGEGDDRVYLCGRIDRIDRGANEDHHFFTIIDYKTGRAPRFTELAAYEGAAIQLPLYHYVARQLELVTEDAVPYQLGYWSLKEKGFTSGLKDRSSKLKPIDPELVARMESSLKVVIPELVRRIRSGMFMVYNSDPNCQERCSWATTCRVGQLRPLEQTRAKVRPALPTPEE